MELPMQSVTVLTDMSTLEVIDKASADASGQSTLHPIGSDRATLNAPADLSSIHCSRPLARVSCKGTRVLQHHNIASLRATARGFDMCELVIFAREWKVRRMHHMLLPVEHPQLGEIKLAVIVARSREEIRKIPLCINKGLR